MALIPFLFAALIALASWTAAGPPRADPPGAVSIALDEPAPAIRLPVIEGSRNPDRPLVIIDAGHGGHDPGATAGGRVEKRVVLQIARAIRDELAASGKVRVALTRDEDRFIDLRERYAIARALKADLFVSVHADAAPANDAAHGATVYTLSEVASDREAALLAQRENRSGVIDGVTLSQDAGVNLVLIDLAQRRSMDISADFARLLKREAEAFFPFRPEYHRFASLIVLKAPDIPSVLFESGYLTNRRDSDYIHSPEGQQQIATGMRRAIEAHFARRALRSAARDLPPPGPIG